MSKGSLRRPQQVSRDRWAENFARTFGGRVFRCAKGHEFAVSGEEPWPIYECLHTEPLGPGYLPDCDGHCKAPVTQVAA